MSTHQFETQFESNDLVPSRDERKNLKNSNDTENQCIRSGDSKGKQHRKPAKYSRCFSAAASYPGSRNDFKSPNERATKRKKSLKISCRDAAARQPSRRSGESINNGDGEHLIPADSRESSRSFATRLSLFTAFFLSPHDYLNGGISVRSVSPLRQSDTRRIVALTL